MKNKANILSKINSFKNNVIDGGSDKTNSNKTNTCQISKISFEISPKIDVYIKNRTNFPDKCISAHRINNYKHTRITAKNKDNNNLGNTHSSSYKKMKQKNFSNDTLSLSGKISNKILPNKIKQYKNNKKETKTITSKRNNSSNNILIRRNKSIGNMAKFLVRKNNDAKENKKIKKNSENKIIEKNNNIIQKNTIVQNNQFQMVNNNYNSHMNISNNNNYQQLNNNNINKNGIIVNSITIGNFNKTFNSLENIELSNRNRKNTSIKSKTKIVPSDKYSSLLDNFNLNYNIYKSKKCSSRDKNDIKLKRFNDDIQNILILCKEEKLQRKPKLNKIRKNEIEKTEVNNIRNNHKIEINKKKKEINNITNTNKNIGNNLMKRKSDILYQYIILKGNASYLVKYCMQHRINWIEGNIPDPESTPFFNFKWKELSGGIDYFNLNKNPKMKQMVNHYEFHYVISNKANLFINLMRYCEKNNLSVFKYVPFTIVFKIKDRRKIKNKAKQKRWMEKLEKLKNFIQRIDTKVTNYNNIGNYYKDEEYIQDKKDRDEFELNKLRKKSKKEEEGKKIDDEKFKGLFETYSDVFPRLKRIDKSGKNKEQNDGKEKEKEKKAPRIIGSNTLIEIPTTHFKGKNMWVLKAVNLNRGMCIKVVNSFQQMEKVINKFKSGVDYSNFTLEKIEEPENNSGDNEEENNQAKNIDNAEINKDKEKLCQEDKEERLYNCNKILIQKYIESPLLYKGRKCDMRIWVLLTHDMKVYLFKEGHLKTCSVQYNLNSEDAFTHITNYSFQKYNSNFQKFEKGNEVPFYEFQKFIDETYPEKNYKLKINLMKQLKEIIKVTMLCGKNKINRNNRNFQFEIFGYDFMMDSDFNVFLIEINYNPGLEISSPWIQIVVPRMLDDALRLTLDKVFDPIYDFNKNYKGDYTPEQKKMLTNSEIKFDFNAVENNHNNNNINKKNTTSTLTKDSSTPSQISSQSKSVHPLSGDILLNINMDLDDFDKQLLKDNISENEKNNENNNLYKEETRNVEVDNKNNEQNMDKTSKNNKKKKIKYISPFPVPGYSMEENLWEFVCDLNLKDKDKEKEKEKEKEKINHDIMKTKNIQNKPNYTGIKHLLKRKKTKPKDGFEKNKDK